MATFVSEPDPRVREVAASVASGETLEALRRDRMPRVRAAVPANPNSDDLLLAKMMGDPSPKVRKAAHTAHTARTTK